MGFNAVPSIELLKFRYIKHFIYTCSSTKAYIVAFVSEISIFTGISENVCETLTINVYLEERDRAKTAILFKKKKLFL